MDNHDHDHDDDDDDEYNTTSKLDVRDSTKAMMMVVRAGSKQRTGKPKSDKRRQPGPNLDASKPAKLHSTSPNPQLTPNAGGEPSTIIANYLPEDIAQQLCVVNFHHYSYVFSSPFQPNTRRRAKFTELHHLSWTKPGKAPNLDIAAKHLDDLSLVFAYLILSEKMAAKRAKMITLILQVGEVSTCNWSLLTIIAPPAIPKLSIACVSIPHIVIWTYSKTQKYLEIRIQ